MFFSIVASVFFQVPHTDLSSACMNEKKIFMFYY